MYENGQKACCGFSCEVQAFGGGEFHGTLAEVKCLTTWQVRIRCVNLVGKGVTRRPVPFLGLHQSLCALRHPCSWY